MSARTSRNGPTNGIASSAAEQAHQGERDEYEPHDGEGEGEQREQEDPQSGGQIGEFAQALGQGFRGAGRVHGTGTRQPPAM